MRKPTKRQMIWMILTLVACVVFVAFTLVVALADVTDVGLSHVNHYFWRLWGASTVWQTVTDWLGYAVILMVFGFCVLQVWQWVRRKSLRQVDRNLWAMDAVLVAFVVVYCFFEIVVVNYRPMLVDGVAKASYPSTHAMLFVTLVPLLIGQVWHYLKSQPWCIVLTVVLALVLMVGVVGRMLSGVHWFTDIIGGVLMGGVLNCLYFALDTPTNKE